MSYNATPRQRRIVTAPVPSAGATSVGSGPNTDAVSASMHINYMVDQSSGSLRPRDGLRTSELYQASDGVPVLMMDDISIAGSCDHVPESGTAYRQIVTRGHGSDGRLMQQLHTVKLEDAKTGDTASVRWSGHYHYDGSHTLNEERLEAVLNAPTRVTPIRERQPDILSRPLTSDDAIQVEPINPVLYDGANYYYFGAREKGFEREAPQYNICYGGRKDAAWCEVFPGGPMYLKQDEYYVLEGAWPYINMLTGQYVISLDLKTLPYSRSRTEWTREPRYVFPSDSRDGQTMYYKVIGNDLEGERLIVEQYSVLATPKIHSEDVTYRNGDLCIYAGTVYAYSGQNPSRGPWNPASWTSIKDMALWFEEHNVNSYYRHVSLQAKQPTPNEAQQIGFNMLLKDPYVYFNKVEGQEWVTQGILPYEPGSTLDDSDARVQVFPTVGQETLFRIFYTVPQGYDANNGVAGRKYNLKLEWRARGTSTWTELPVRIDGVVASTLIAPAKAIPSKDMPDVTAVFTPPLAEFDMQLTVQKYSDVNGNVPPTAPPAYSSQREWPQGAQVRHDGAIYVAATNTKQTPGSGAEWGSAIAYNAFIKDSAKSNVYPYETNKQYYIGDLAYTLETDGETVSKIYVCRSVTAGAFNASSWDSGTLPAKFCEDAVEEWTGQKVYYFGDLVTYGGAVYRCDTSVVIASGSAPPNTFVRVGTIAEWQEQSYVLYQIPVSVYASSFEYLPQNAGKNLDIYGAEEDGTQQDSRLRRYELDRSEGMAYWDKRLVLWGVPGNDAKNMIFCSHVEDPTWFPMPGGVDFFPEAVQYCASLGTELLVFTRSMLFLLSSDGMGGWSNQVIYNNLNIASEDYKYVVAIKNMLFFKSGKYFYLVVPKQTGGLTVAPISKPVTDMLDNWVLDPEMPRKYYDSRPRGFLQEQLEELYDIRVPDSMEDQAYDDVKRYEFKAVPGTEYAFFDYDSVHVRAAYTNDILPTWAVVDMVYNTTVRMWSIEVFDCEAGQLPYPHMANVTKRGYQIALYRGKSSSSDPSDMIEAGAYWTRISGAEGGVASYFATLHASGYAGFADKDILHVTRTEPEPAELPVIFSETLIDETSYLDSMYAGLIQVKYVLFDGTASRMSITRCTNISYVGDVLPTEKTSFEDDVEPGASRMFELTFTRWKQSGTQNVMVLTGVRRLSLEEWPQLTRHNPGFQFMEYMRERKDDFYVSQSYVTPPYYSLQIDPRISPYDLMADRAFPNWQLYDTGYRDHLAVYKRYREVVIGMVNTDAAQALTFATDVWVDGEQAKRSYRYIVADEPEREGRTLTYSIVREELPQSILPGETYAAMTKDARLPDEEHPRNLWDQGLTEAEDPESRFWTLDCSAFPEGSLWQIRVKLGSVKGMYPRLRLVSRNEHEYLLVDVSWVYRTMNARGKRGGWAGTEGTGTWQQPKSYSRS